MGVKPFERPFFSYGGGVYSSVNTPEGVYPTPLYRAIPHAMSPAFALDFVDWTYTNRHFFTAGGDRVHRRDQEIVGLPSCGRFGEELHKTLLQLYEEAIEPCGVEPFTATWCEMNCVGFLHGDRFGWHTDHFQSSVNLRRETKAITFIYYAHTEPRAFTGGGLEFADGTIIEPDNDLLLFMNPYQRHRVLPVEIPAGADPWRGGRWTLSGWLHRPAAGLPVPTWPQEPGAPKNYVCQL